jgi:hypothetical protein
MGKKMQWLIDAINDNRTEKTFKFRLSDSDMRHGTVCMPTGTGKSGVMIENILRDTVRGIRNRIIPTVINISCPTLKLAQQLITDLFEVIDGVIRDQCDKVGLVLNSSDLASHYRTYGVSIYSGNFADAMNMALKEKRVIVVASCHKSMQKFVSTMEAIKAYDINACYICNYIDESHMLSVKGVFDFGDGPQVDLYRLNEISGSLYLFSATPDLNMTKMVSDNGGEDYIYRMYPIEAIHENLILPPRIRTFRTDLPGNIELYEYILEESKMFGGNRKILITLKTTDEMRHVANMLEQRGYKVFGACAADGFTGEDDLTDAVKFAEAVDVWNGDCFVLQIKQLTQGTDIRTLTDAVIPVSNDISPKTYRHLLQTMGRVMRAAPGERGMNYEHRTKKAGNIFFMVDDDSSLNKEESLKRFAIRYYGMECTEYGEGFSLLAEMTQENESTKRNIRERIMNESNIIKFFVNAMGQSIEQEAENIIMKIDSELYGIDAKNIPEYHLLDNRSLIKYAVNEIKKIL